MRFDYTGIISLTADTGDHVAIFRPEIQLVVHGPRGSREVRALVDTGADEETIILGHQGFLDYFTATFIGEECALELEPNSYLPSTADVNH